MKEVKINVSDYSCSSVLRILDRYLSNTLEDYLKGQINHEALDTKFIVESDEIFTDESGRMFSGDTKVIEMFINIEDNIVEQPPTDNKENK